MCGPLSDMPLALLRESVAIAGVPVWRARAAVNIVSGCPIRPLLG